MAKIKKKVKKYIKKNEPHYKDMDKAQKKVAKANFEESVELYRKDLKKAKRKKRFRRLLLLCFCITSMKTWRAFHSKESKKYKRRELGRR
ncbi:MAG: hypothetical protein IJ241_03510 [Clostridia bacterium]|nr:hypothetical protein [Clostridia bacterium]MBQ8925740.1 hypothetical protein [Clostridia bacterium]